MQIATRERLPNIRPGNTHRFEIRGKPVDPEDDGIYKGYLTVNTYPDGRPAEIFVRMAKTGSTVNGFIDAWAVAVSILLQTGTPIEVVCNKYRSAQFEPAGMTDNPEIPFARSPLDYIARWLEMRYIGIDSRAPSPEHEAEPQCEVCESVGQQGEDVALRRGRWLCAHHGKGLA